MIPPYRPGQFVWCRFPTAEQPLVPGPKSRIGYIVDISPSLVAATIYTTTAAMHVDRLPLGVIPIDERQATKLGQRPFVMDLRCAAFLPITAAFFPHLTRADNGVKGEAPAGLAHKIRATLVEMRRRRIVIDVRGPGRPRR